jgi:hypothetical protein
LSAIFRLARPAWRLRLDYQATKNAHAVLSDMGITSKAAKRERHPRQTRFADAALCRDSHAGSAPNLDAPDRAARTVLDKAQEEITRIA